MQVGQVSSQKRSGTVLFADVAGFTDFAERVGEEASFNLIQMVTTLMQDAISAQHGTVGEFRGDGVMALFSVTQGLEDGPLRACRAALQIQRSLHDARIEMTAKYGEAVKVRVGMHCGPLVIGDVGDETKSHMTIIGDTANVASRLEAMAEPGQILISRDLYSLVEGQVVAQDLGDQKLRGKSRMERLYKLQDIKEDASRFAASRSRGLSTLFDREGELSSLATVFDDACRSKISVANICGEAGIGKSRLLYEFRETLPKDGVQVIKGDCRADGTTTPFQVFADMLRRILRIGTRDDARVTEGKIATILNDINFDVDETLPYLMTMLGKDSGSHIPRNDSADMTGARMRQVLIDLITHLCKSAPLILIFEDMHWSDPGTQQVVERLVQLDTDIPLMMVCTFRPSFQSPWNAHPRVTNIFPQPISEAGISSMIRETMAGLDHAEELAQKAIAKAEGNPLYAEEIARFLIQKQTNTGADSVVSEDIALPTNLQNMVMERFDKLGKPCRDILQAGATLGRRFDAQFACRIVDDDGIFDSSVLQEAVDVDLIRITSKSGTHYQFKHALVQDAIYDTLLKSQRKSLHARIATKLEDRFANRLDEAAESLAFHFDQADMPDQAALHLVAAGSRNLKLFSLPVADMSFARAFELIEDKNLDVPSPLIAELFAGWFEVQQWQAEFGRTVDLFEKQRKHLSRVTEDPRYPRILGLVGVAYCQDMQFDLAKQKLDDAIEIGEKLNDRDAMTHSYLGLMVIECSRPRKGSFERNQDMAKRINALLGDEDQPYYRTYCNFYANWSNSIRGDIDKALELGHTLIDLGKRSNFSGAVGWGAICVAFNEAYSENFDTAIEYASIGADAAGGLVDQLVCLGLKGLSMILAGDVEGGGKILNDIFERRKELDFRGVENIVDGPIGMAKVLDGDLGGGVQWIENAIDRAVASGNTHGAAMSHISLGTIYLQLATSNERPDLATLSKNFWFLAKSVPFAKSKAIAHFEEAIELGREADMFGVMAQALHGKSMALKAARKSDLARETLLEAKDAISNIRWSMMQKRIEEALADTHA